MRAARLIAIVVFAIVAFVGLFMLRQPGPLQGTTTKLHLETVAAIGQALEWPRPNDPHPDWVGYLPTTTWHVPANSTIEVQIDQAAAPGPKSSSVARRSLSNRSFRSVSWKRASGCLPPRRRRSPRRAAR